MADLNRRDFIRLAGAGTLAAGAAVAGCSPKEAASEPSVEGTSGEMAYRINPKTGDKVSLLGYGCMRWQMTTDENGNEVIDQEKVNELVDYALAHGVNYFDTSPAYLQGMSERATGIALSRHPRESYYLATKLSNFGDHSAEASLQMYKDSFSEMFTEYFDYYLLHSIGRGGLEAFRERYVDNGIMDFLLKEREEGRIRNLGFSFHGAPEAFDDFLSLYGEYNWDFVQIEMNYVDWRHAEDWNTNAEYLYNRLDELQIPVVIMEPLLGGRLASVPKALSNRFHEKDATASDAAWSFRFNGSFPRVLTVLSGMTYMSDLRENVETYSNFKPMNAEELEFMEQMAIMYKEYPHVNCTGCSYCMPCPFGINIPGIFKHYNRAINDGTFAQTSQQSDYLKLKQKYLLTYNEDIPTLRQSDHCIACGECLSHCPQSIEIPSELQRINDYVEKLKRDTL